LALAIATVFLIAMMGSASALYPCPAPGNTEISSSCELTQDYTVSAGQYGYRITADNVVMLVNLILRTMQEFTSSVERM
jgi:hypothetical protein